LKSKKRIVFPRRAASVLANNDERYFRRWSDKIISYNNHSLLWQERRPILLLFETGKGMADSVLESTDYSQIPLNR